MPTYSVTITEEEDRILRSWVLDPQEWLVNAFVAKLRKRVAASILEETNLNPKKMTMDEQIEALKDVDLPKREDRQQVVRTAQPE